MNPWEWGSRFVLLCLLPVAVCGCRRESEQAADDSAGYVALVGTAQGDPLWPVLRAKAAGFDSGARRLGIRVEAPPVVSPNLARELIEKLDGPRLRGLCVQVGDAAALAGTLESLRTRGIPVVTMMHPVRAEPPFLHSGPDPAAEGEALADALAERIGDKGMVGAVFWAADEQAETRRAAFHERLARHADIVLLREIDCGGTPQAARRMMAEAQERFPSLAGWAAMGPWPLLGTTGGESGAAEHIILVAPGPVADPLGVVRSGRCDALILSDDAAMVARALEMCLLAMRGGEVYQPRFDAPLRKVTRDNLPRFEQEWKAWTTPPK